MTKRTLAMLLALLALLLTGCGNAEPKTTEAEIGSQSTDDAAALPDTTEQKPVADAPMMVMVDNTLYQSTGEVSTVDGRCGNMDGEITSQTANGTDAPTETMFRPKTTSPISAITGILCSLTRIPFTFPQRRTGWNSRSSPTRMYKNFCSKPYFI